MGSYRHLAVQVDAGIATITISRPDRLNALTGRTIDELIEALRDVNGSDDVRAAVVTGSGRAFCAGIDLGGGDQAFRAQSSASGGERPAEPADSFADISGPLALAIYRSHKPIVAAVNGAAVGVGATMILPMDVRLASTEARFAFPFTRRGISPDACSSWFLPRVVGISRALEWCLGGQLISADDAMVGGLVRSIHPPDELMTTAREVAHALSTRGAPVSAAITRRLMWRMLGIDGPEHAHRLESLSLASRGASNDAKEGVRAFMQKRDPVFPDLVSRDLPDWFREWDAP